MYAITGITGKVGGAVAHTLLAASQPVRAVVRDPRRAQAWAERGCEVVAANMDDAASLAAAFEGVAGVFILPPSEFDPLPGFPEARAVIDAVRDALESSRTRQGCLPFDDRRAGHRIQSADPTHADGTGAQRTTDARHVPASRLVHGKRCMGRRPGARRRDRSQFLQPLDKAVPMVATADVGRVAAQLLQETWSGMRVVELEGPQRVSPNELAAAFAEMLGRPVRAEAVPRETWDALFRAQGTKDPMPRIRMLDGFNEGWIDFEGDQATVVKGRVELKTVLRELVSQAG